MARVGTGTGGPTARASRAGAATFAVVLVVLSTLGAALLGDGDTSWHLATGRLVLADGLPAVDPFSFTFAGEPWIAKEWLAQVLLVVADDLAGWAGVVLLTAAAVGLAFGVVAAHAAPHLDDRAVVVALGAGFVLAAPHLLARPHALALPVVVAFTALLVRSLDGGRPGPPWPALLLVVLWANLHGGVLLAVALAGGAALEAVVASSPPARTGVATRWGGFVLATGAALLVTPYGIGTVRAALDVLTLGPALDVIPEWAPLDLSTLDGTTVVLLAGLGAVLVGGVRLPWPRALVLLGLLWLALAAVRNGPLLGLLAPVLLAAPLAVRSPGLATDGTAGPAVTPRPGRARAATGLLATLALVVSAAVLVVRPPEPPPVITPVAATSRAVEAGAQRLLHEYAWGGHLIERGVPTFVDGRTELFGGRFVADHAAALTLADVGLLDRLLVEHDVDATMLRPGTPAVDLLDLSPTWTRVHVDDVAVVHVRVVGASPGLGSGDG